MKVDIWSEVTCPWCGLGNHRTARAIERFEHADEVDLVHHSFPLSSSFPEGETLSVREALLRRHGVGGGQAETATRRIERIAESEGLTPYRVLDNRVGNTDLAHEFLAHASAQGRNREAWDAIFTIYFGRAEPVFSLDDLLGLADGLGLDREQTRQALTDHRYRRQVRDDAARARRLGATGAPFIVVDGRYVVPGAQDSDSLLELLRKVWDAGRPRTRLGDAPVSAKGI
ncbi:DsbA family oxidoreductase [Actinoplanes sichuanensis]|uniref:DsbA family protein n=1 Tax=Actinoplanes sichuanensis TaxID=512349 RepID=A0ABW4AQ36_9ACTN|nr:DsbA family oxidoreductase [Actinoplanes sichuanensis]BEL05042.1 DsbA family oxidoreductase [Actinoplanes sichuanensis]